MADDTERRVLLPRYTTLVGAGPFYTKPISVRAYGSAYVTSSVSKGRGTSLAASIDVEKSSDLSVWGVSNTLTPTSTDEDTERVDDDREWMRLKISLSGTGDLSASLWVVGEFVLRDA